MKAQARVIVISKFDKVNEYFEDELGKHDTFKDAFDTANKRFQEETGLEGYSSYKSFSVVRSRKRD